MNLKQIERKIEEFGFPVFPQMLVQVQKVASDEHSSAQDLAEIILKDQSLTSKILSVSNSAYYGFYGKVSTITQSIVVLGFDSVKNIALGLAVHNSLSSFMNDPSIKQFWEHSLATGVCAELLAEKMGYTPSEEALVGGLIHDVGKLLLFQFYPEEYAEVEKRSEDATLMRFMKKYCEKQSNTLLRHRRKSLNDAHNRGTITLPKHAEPWKSGNSGIL